MLYPHFYIVRQSVFRNFAVEKTSKLKQKQGICPAFAATYYTIPKLIRELKPETEANVNRTYYTIPKLIRELKPIA